MISVLFLLNSPYSYLICYFSPLNFSHIPSWLYFRTLMHVILVLLDLFFVCCWFLGASWSFLYSDAQTIYCAFLYHQSYLHFCYFWILYFIFFFHTSLCFAAKVCHGFFVFLKHSQHSVTEVTWEFRKLVVTGEVFCIIIFSHCSTCICHVCCIPVVLRMFLYLALSSSPIFSERLGRYGSSPSSLNDKKHKYEQHEFDE